VKMIEVETMSVRRRRPADDGPLTYRTPELCSHRSDGRAHDTGLIRPYRPCPADFRERFLEMGWDGIEDHYGTNWRVIRRWIAEAGGEELRAARREVSGGTPRPNRRSRYVLGRTLTAKAKP
jgi:hypothetical protein